MRSLITHIVVAGLLLWAALPGAPEGRVLAGPAGEASRQAHPSH